MEINIMTACDNNYVDLLYPQLKSIEQTQAQHKINFFLLFNRISEEKLEMLKEYIKKLNNITFYPIKITEDISAYNRLASAGGGTPSGDDLLG